MQKFLVFLFMVMLSAGNLLADEIEIIGLQKVAKSTVLAYLPQNFSKSNSQELLDKSTKDLYASGFFSDVKITLKGSNITIKIQENPTIYKIAFEGNKAIKDSELKTAVSMKEMSFFSAMALQRDIDALISAYQKRGWHNVKIQTQKIELDQNRINLIYQITENNKALIKKINFIGNTQYPDHLLLRKIMSRPAAWYRFFSAVDVYDRDRILFDIEQLRNFYQDEGYADFEVLSHSAELTPDLSGFIVNFVMHEGHEYRYSGSDIMSDIPVDVNVLQKLIKFKSGDLLRISKINESIDEITKYLGQNGYSFVKVDHTLERDHSAKTAKIKLTINKSYKAYLRYINIKNNTRTLDKVIRRELRISEGDPYNVTKIARSRQRIERLGFFKTVELKNIPTQEDDRVDLDIIVEEQGTGEFRIAGGYNTLDGILGMLSYNEMNWGGSGQKIGVSLAKAERSLDIDLSFSEPYFMGEQLEVGWDLFSMSRNREKESSYKNKIAGFSLHMGYDLMEYLHHGLRYTIKRNNIYDIADNASLLIKSQAGMTKTSAIGHTLLYDRLDSGIMPNSGYYVKLTQDLAGLGLDSRYIDNKIKGEYYFPIYKKDLTLVLTGRGGITTAWGGRSLSIAEHTFLTQEEIRGFSNYGIGPRDKVTGDAMGGRMFYSGNAEMRYSLSSLIPGPNLALVGFVDVASVFGMQMKNQNMNQLYYDKKPRSSTGVSLVYYSDMLGKIRLDYGVAIHKQPYDRTKNFSISYSGIF